MESDLKKLFLIHLKEPFSLRLLMPSDAKELYKLVDKNRLRLSKFLPWAMSLTLAKEEEFLLSGVESFEKRTLLQYAICKNEQIIGVIDFHAISKNNRCAEIGYWLDVDFEGKGIMQNAVIKASESVSSVLGLHRIVIDAEPDNIASQKVALNAGFAFEGLKHDALKVADGYRDLVVFYKLY